VQRALAIACFVFAASAAHAQVVELRAGSSNEIGASGGQLSLYLPSSTFQFNAGINSGMPVFGASAVTAWRGNTIHFGDEMVELSGGDLSLDAPVRGVVFRRKNFQAFAGATGDVFNTPFLFTERTQHFGAGLSWHWRDVSLAGAIIGSQRTFIESYRHYWGAHFYTAESAGLVSSMFYSVATASWHANHFAAGITHNDFLYNGERAEVNSESFSAYGDGFSAYYSNFQSRISGSAFGGAWRGRLLSIQAGETRSTQNDFLGTVTVNVSPRIHVSGSITRSARTAFNAGGGWSGNLISFDLSYQQEFLPFSTGPTPFAKVAAVRITLQLPWRGITVNAATTAAPNGGTRWELYGGGFTGQPGAASGHAVATQRVTGAEVSGIAVDAKSGMPVEGVAVKIGKAEVFTNAAGVFSVRVNGVAAMPVAVVPDDFTAPGEWQVVAAPASAAPGVPIHIVVSR
jgi:hypothetical protein